MAAGDPISSVDVLRSAAHPLRLQLLALLDEEPQSPVRLARRLDEGLERVAYHVKRLEAVGLVELVDTRRRRGAVEHIYATTARAPFSDEAWGALDAETRQRLVVPALHLLAASALDAAAGGGFDRADAHLTRWSLRLDEEGWRELTAAAAAWVAAAAEIEARAAARGTERFPATLAVLLFEATARPAPDEPD